METKKEFLTVEEVARLFSVNDETVRRWIRSKEKKLNAELISKKQGYRISQLDVIEFASKYKTDELNKNQIIQSSINNFKKNGTIMTDLGIVGAIGAGFATSMIGLPVLATAIAGLAGTNIALKIAKQLKEKQKVENDVLLELFNVERKLQQEKTRISMSILRLQNDEKIIDDQLHQITKLLNVLTEQQEFNIDTER